MFKVSLDQYRRILTTRGYYCSSVLENCLLACKSILHCTCTLFLPRLLGVEIELILAPVFTESSYSG